MISGINDFVQVYSDSLEWGQGLIRIPSEAWHTPMQEGGWSVAECLAHLIAWDRFMITERFQNLHGGVNCTHRPDGEKINSDAAKYARSGVSQETLIEEFVAVRLSLIALVRRMSQNSGDIEFSIYGKPMTLSVYLLGQAEHYSHHQVQIDRFIQGSEYT